jgi:hypothetical protein
MDIPENGPIPTSFSFDTVPDYKLEGKAFEVLNLRRSLTRLSASE